MGLVIGLAVLLMILYVRSEYEKRSIAVEHVTIESAKIHNKQTFIFLSDLHNHSLGTDHELIRKKIDLLKPDYILIGGDSIVSRKDGQVYLQQAIALIETLAASYQVYHANGNHECRLFWKKELYHDCYWAFKTQLEAAGVIYLSDQSVNVGTDVRLTGINLPSSVYRKIGSNQYDSIKAEDIVRQVGHSKLEGEERFQILLAHSPLFFDEYRQWGADLTLSGHFHGGTIRLPVLGGVMTPQFQFFSPYCAGIFTEEGKSLLISRGLGTHSINIRLNNKPQLIVVHLSS